MKFLALGGLIAFAAVASAQNAYFSGSLAAGDPVFNRPLEGASSLSGVGTAVFYDVQPFYVAAAGTFTFETVSSNPTYDTFVLIYQNSFNAATPLVNHVGSDDDFTGAFTILPGPYAVPAAGTGSAGTAPASQVLNVALTNGIQYYAINTSFSNAAVGNYFSGIGGRSVTGAPIDVTLGLIPTVPEPTSMAALAIGAAALLRRRRKN